MRISLIISSLGSGGAERVLTGIANFLQDKGYEVTIITYTDATVGFYSLDPSIKRIKLNLNAISKSYFDAALNLYNRIKKLRQAILQSQPDRIISFIDRSNILTLLACRDTDIPVIISERTNPLYYPIGRFWGLLRYLLYRYADYLVIQTESIKPWAQTHIDIARIAVIANALDVNRLHEIRQSTQPIKRKRAWHKTIITMGRFTSEKGHDLLIKSVKPLLEANLDWGLEIIGDGPLNQNLIQLVMDLGLQNQVFFHGQVSNPFCLLKSADIFVLPSRIEGFPNALLEAMALGLPCISFDCPSGPADLIKHNYNGLLVEKENISAMTRAIQECMESEILRSRLGEQAKMVIERYAEANIMAQWEKLLIK